MARIVNILSDYPRQDENAELLAIISFIQEKRKKKGIFSRKEEVISSIRRGIIPIYQLEGDAFSFLYDGLCAFNTSFSLQDVGSWEHALHTLWRAHDNYLDFLSHIRALRRFSPPTREIVLRGLVSSKLYVLLRNVREGDVQAPRDRCSPDQVLRDILPIVAKLDEFTEYAVRFRDLASRLRSLGESVRISLDDMTRSLPPDSGLRRRYQATKEEIRSVVADIADRLEEAAAQYENLINSLKSAPSIDKVYLPVYLVETKGKKQRSFIISNLRFKAPGLTYKIKGIFGKFDSLFDETRINRVISSILDPTSVEWSSNLLTEEIKDGIYAELARLESDGYIDEDYVGAVAELISKSLL